MQLPDLKSIVAKCAFPRQGPTVLNGWLHRKPKKMSKNLTFAQIRDPRGNIVQVVDHNYPSVFKGIKQDSIVSVEGKMQDEFLVSKVQVLNHANILPSQLHDTKECPPQYRYIQLRQPEMQQILRKRSSIIKACRDVLVAEQFTEVETPLLFKSTPEGAREFLVPTRKRNQFYALPQSPQQYKQLLIASGIDRYFQVAKCFRDEDLRADRQPEFTQLDLEMGFANHQDVQQVVTKVVNEIWKFAQTSLEWWPHLTYDDAIANYGIDKPDLRFDAKIRQLPARARAHPEYPVFEALVLAPGTDLNTIQQRGLYAGRVPKFVIYESEAQLKAEIEALADVHDWDALFDSLELEPRSVVCLSDRRVKNYENPTPLGRSRQLYIESQLPPGESIAFWVHKFPLFEPVETGQTKTGYPVYDTQTLKATHHPFTMVDLDTYSQLETNPLECIGQHFDLVIDGVECGGGSTRVHDHAVQDYILRNVLKIPNPDALFGHLLAALASGCPPHAGLAIGLDRIVAMICGRKSIRDVIAFPKTISGQDPMIGSPSAVTDSQLAPYFVKTSTGI